MDRDQAGDAEVLGTYVRTCTRRTSASAQSIATGPSLATPDVESQAPHGPTENLIYFIPAPRVGPAHHDTE